MNNDNQTTTLEPAPEVNPFAERAAQEAVKPKKASVLSQVTVRKRKRPIFALLYGPPGVGKSTWASKSPKPIFIQCERGLDQINVPRFPIPETLNDYKLQIQALVNEEHDYETIVIDTLDGLELLIWDDVCRIGKCDSIEDYGGGWSKGYVKAREIWTKVLERLTDMSERFNILLIAHAHIRTISDPSLSVPFDQWKIRLNDKSAEIVKQMVDSLLFVNIQRTVDKESAKSRKGRAIVGEDRELITQPTTGVEAKNRYDLESPMEFSWAALQDGINRFYDK